MNLIDALRSGKAFRRRKFSHIAFTAFDKIKQCQFDVEDVLADDWEILPGPAIFTVEIIEADTAGLCVVGELGRIRSLQLAPFIGKQVRVEVTVIE